MCLFAPYTNLIQNQYISIFQIMNILLQNSYSNSPIIHFRIITRNNQIYCVNVTFYIFFIPYAMFHNQNNFIPLNLLFSGTFWQCSCEVLLRSSRKTNFTPLESTGQASQHLQLSGKEDPDWRCALEVRCKLDWLEKGVHCLHCSIVCSSIGKDHHKQTAITPRTLHQPKSTRGCIHNHNTDYPHSSIVHYHKGPIHSSDQQPFRSNKGMPNT